MGTCFKSATDPPRGLFLNFEAEDFKSLPALGARLLGVGHFNHLPQKLVSLQTRRPTSISIYELGEDSEDEPGLIHPQRNRTVDLYYEMSKAGFNQALETIQMILGA